MRERHKFTRGDAIVNAPARRRALGPKARELRFARRCYDHLAGRLGVAITLRLQEKRLIVAAPGQRFDVTPDGVRWFDAIGLAVREVRPTRRGLARPCLDWTERLPHLGGPLGVRLLDTLCANGWLRKTPGWRAVRITAQGELELRRRLQIDAGALRRSED